MANAQLVHELITGLRNTDGTALASGTVYFYLPNTLTQTTVYSDDQGASALSQPIILNAGGQAAVFVTGPVRMLAQTATVPVTTVVDRLVSVARAEAVTTTSAAFTGTDLKSNLDTALVAFGGTDFNYKPSAGGVNMRPQAWMNGVHRNVKAYGATGDGVTPDDSAIAAAIADVVANGGGIVYFPPGTYLCNAAIAVTGASGVNLRGAGAFSTIIKQNGGAANGLTVTTCSQFSIADITVTHSSTSNGAAISVTGGSAIVLSNVLVNASALFLTGLSLASTSLISVQGGTISCQDTGSGRAILATSTTKMIMVGTAVSGGPLNGGVGIEFTGSSDRFLGVGLTGGSSGSGTCVKFNAALTGNHSFDFVCCNGFFTSGGTAVSMGVSVDPGLHFVESGVNGATVNVLTGGTVTPDRTQGAMWRIRGTTTGAAYTIAAPTPTPIDPNTRLTLVLHNNAGGAVTGWTMNAAYHTTGAISTTDGQISTVQFVWDTFSSVWREVSRAVTT